ncbi:hypothetical protein AMJ47_02365 [Parcubacteria bacterium DG_72]|nr:MAG: hypothetical protein AMJ47_02365 [Parcubacteria bacterium DG_72]
MEIIKCDKCKKLLKPKGKDKTIRKASGTIRVSGSYEWLSFDLCEKCSLKLIKFVKNYLKT